MASGQIRLRRIGRGSERAQVLGAAFMRLAQDGSLCLDALEQLGEQSRRRSRPLICSSSASASTSMPACSTPAITASASLVSVDSNAPTLPWRPNASKVASGMVLTVFSAASAVT